MISNSALNQHFIGTGTPGATYTTSAPQTGWNQELMKLAEVFEPFIQKSLLANPRFWYNIIPRGAFPNFNGTERETRIFRGGLQHYAGLQDWDAISSDPDTVTAVPGGYTTPSYAWEKLNWSGFKRRWGSDPVNLDTMKYVQRAQEQLAWILQVGADYGVSLQEVFNRDMLLKFALTYDRQLIMCRDTVGARASAPKFAYDPFVGTFATTALYNASTLTNKVHPDTGITAPFLVFPLSAEVEPLNFDVLDFLHQDLDVSCPGTALSTNGNERIFGLPTSAFDFERYIRGNDWETKNWRETRSEQLINGMAQGVKNHRGWAMSFDENQLRFKVNRFILSYDSDQFGGVGSAFDGQQVVVAQYVAPRVAGRVGEGGRQIPEFNPEYVTAELAVMPTLQKDIFTNMMGTEINDLGSQTFFGPQAGLNGVWKWINIPDPATNPEGLVGNFRGRFEIFPKPDASIFYATALLYRRCTAPIRSLCPVDNAELNKDTGTGAVAATTAVYSKASYTNDTVTLTAKLVSTLVDAGPGSPVSVTINVGASTEVLEGYVTFDASAPRYVIDIVGMTTIKATASTTDGEYWVAGGKLMKYVTDAAVETSLASITAL